MGRRGCGAVALAAAAVLTMGAPANGTPAQEEAGQEIVLSGEGNRLNAYDAVTGEKHTVIPSAADQPDGLDINAEICVVPDHVSWKPVDETWIIAGEDTEQNSEPGVIKQGWGLFRLTGTTLGTLAAEEVAKLVPDSFVTAGDNPENFGCGVLPDGRLVTGDVGDQLPHSPATGQLIVWYPTAEHMTGSIGPDRNDFPRVPHCKIDVGIGTAGGILLDGTDVLIASNRPNLATAEPGGVYRYDSTLWPQSEAPGDGCGRTDSTGEQLADADRVGKSLFIPQAPGLLTTPSDIADSGRGTYYVSSVFTGQVAEYGQDGVFRRHVVTTTGQLGGITPFGIGVTHDGTLWIADIGIVGDGPAQGAGSVVRVAFDEQGNPGPLEVIDEGLEFPDGIGVLVLRGADPAGPAEQADPTGTDPPQADDGDAGEPGAVDAVGASRSGGDGTLPATGGGPPLLMALAALAGAVAAWRTARPPAIGGTR
jgi:hypothetical protein